MWISTRSPWSSLSLFPHLFHSSYSTLTPPVRRIRSSKSYQVSHDDQAFTLRLDVPGLHLDQLAVEVKDQTLQISLKEPSLGTESSDLLDQVHAETQSNPHDEAQPQDETQSQDEAQSHNETEDQGRWIFNELSSFPKTYKFTLPSSVQTDQIQAELKKGQLFLTLPKSQPRVQHIQVQQGV